MPGICAAVSWDGILSPGHPCALVQGMLPILAVPGLASNLWSREDAALGCAIAPALPEAIYDSQPLERQTFVLVADLRLDNRSELARQLSLSHPEMMADSALLAAAWERWGDGCADRLLGGFAVCIWDTQTRELFAARDHTGEFPLFFHRAQGWLAVASRPTALRSIPEVPRGFDEQRIADWLVGTQSNRATSFFEGIERLPAGHTLQASASGVRTSQFWHPSKAKPTRFRRDVEYAEALTDLLDRTVEPRLRTIGGVASQLSAGLDSAAVTASAALCLAGRGVRLTAYTAVPRPGFENDLNSKWIMDEGPQAAEVTESIGSIDHFCISTETVDLVPALERINNHLDEPVLNAVNWLWILAILDHARRHGTTTMLQAANGNGNISYDTIRPLARMLRQGRWVQYARLVARRRAFGVTSLHASAQFAVSTLWPARPGRHSLAELSDPYFDLYPISSEFAAQTRLREASAANLIEPATDAEELRVGFEQVDFGPMNAACYAMTGVDLRDPTNDKRIWDFCFSIPPDQFVIEGLSRSLIRRAMRGRLPATTLARVRRGLQGADWHLTIRQALPALREQLDLIAESPAVNRYLDISKLHHLIDTMPTSDFQKSSTFYTSHLTLLRGIAMGMFLHSHDPEVSIPAAAPVHRQVS